MACSRRNVNDDARRQQSSFEPLQVQPSCPREDAKTLVPTPIYTEAKERTIATPLADAAPKAARHTKL
jgi:hypothetical protein